MNQPLKQVVFVVPGDINTRTGGYRYDKAIIDTLQQLGWQINLVSWVGDYPFPDHTARQAVEKTLTALPDDSTVIIDGLAFSVLPDQLETHHRRLRLVALIHHPLALETGLDAKTARVLTALETRALRHARHVITTSSSTAESLQHYAVNTNIISVVCPGTNQRRIASGSSTPGMNLLSVATLTPRKGHSILIEALKLLEGYAWHLYCAGSTSRDHETYKNLQNQVNSLGLASRISFSGELDDEQLDNQYNQADLFVLASFHEGYGMVLDEAIAYGLPIVATAGGAIADTVPKDAGLLSPPGDAIALADNLRRVMQDDSLLLSLRSEALSARESLRSWHTAAQEFEIALMKSQSCDV